MKNFLPIIIIILIETLGCNQIPEKYPKLTKIPNLDSIVIIFSGDLMQHIPQINAAKIPEGHNYDDQLKYIKKFWQTADFVILNLETTLATTPNYSGYPMFAAPAQIAKALRKAAVTHVALANNHALDKSLKGVESTLKALNDAKIKYTGLALKNENNPKVLIIEKNQLKVAILNHTYGTNGMPIPQKVTINTPLDTTVIKKYIQVAKKQNPTHIIALLHWGDEYQITPNKDQKKLAQWLKNNEVDLVVGSHPHVPQPIDAKNAIVYSLGNLVSNQRKPYTDSGYSVKVVLRKKPHKPIIQFMPHYVDISSQMSEKYRILLPQDSLVVKNSADRKQMNQAIQKTRTVINTPVKYD